MPKWSKGYEIGKNRSRDLQNTVITVNKNTLIHLARLIDNPDSFADNLMTSIFRLKFLTTLPRLRKQVLICDVMVQGMSRDAWDEFSKTISLHSLWGDFLAFQPMP